MGPILCLLSKSLMIRIKTEKESASTAGSTTKSAKEKALDTGQQNNVKVITWLLNSIDQSILCLYNPFPKLLTFGIM